MLRGSTRVLPGSLRARSVRRARIMLKLANQVAKFARQVDIKTRIVKHIVKVVFRGNTTPKREQLHLLCAKFVRKVSGKTRISSQIV